MHLWVAIAIFSAFMQNMRSTLQKVLTGKLSTLGATAARFFFGLPFAYLYFAILLLSGQHPVPALSSLFLLHAAIGAISQIFGTLTLVSLFSYRNFAVGNAYSRTEPAQAALFGLLVMGETASLSTLWAILISMAGVMLVSIARTDLTPRAMLAGTFSKTAAIGLTSGAMFGLSGVEYRNASVRLADSLPAPDFIMQASFTLIVVITLQAGLLALWFGLRDRAELIRVFSQWRPALGSGFAGATASFGWFAAMTMVQASMVKAVGQIEMLFTFASTVLFFREKINRIEVAGCLLVVAGILVLVLG